MDRQAGSAEQSHRSTTSHPCRDWTGLVVVVSDMANDWVSPPDVQNGLAQFRRRVPGRSTSRRHTNWKEKGRNLQSWSTLVEDVQGGGSEGRQTEYLVWQQTRGNEHTGSELVDRKFVCPFLLWTQLKRRRRSRRWSVVPQVKSRLSLATICVLINFPSLIRVVPGRPGSLCSVPVIPLWPPTTTNHPPNIEREGGRLGGQVEGVYEQQRHADSSRSLLVNAKVQLHPHIDDDGGRKKRIIIMEVDWGV